MNLELLARLLKWADRVEVELMLNEMDAWTDHLDLHAFEWIRRITA